MNNVFALVCCVLAGLALSARAEPPAPTADVVRAADAFLATLTPEQRDGVVFRFDDAEQRARWSNFPTGFVRRAGISLKQMNSAQQQAAMLLLASVLSPMGLEKVSEIRQADDDFKANGSKRGPAGHRGPPPGGSQDQRPPPTMNSDEMFGSGLYYLSFLGAPSTTQPWMLQFGGHHLALNITIDGGKGVLTPTLTGAQPAVFQTGGKTIRPLGRESDKALALLQSLRDDQRRKAVLNYAVADLVLGPGQDGKRIVPDGLQAAALDEHQQGLLLDLIGEWTGMLAAPYATPRMAQMRTDLKDTWFAWSGPLTTAPGANITAYYRIQGPHLVIEYAPQSDEPVNHVHSMYRDPTNDYGIAAQSP